MTNEISKTPESRIERAERTRVAISHFVSTGDTTRLIELILGTPETSRHTIFRTAILALDINNEAAPLDRAKIRNLINLDTTSLTGAMTRNDFLRAIAGIDNPKLVTRVCALLSIKESRNLGFIDSEFCSPKRASEYIGSAASKAYAELKRLNSLDKDDGLYWEDDKSNSGRITDEIEEARRGFEEALSELTKLLTTFIDRDDKESDYCDKIAKHLIETKNWTSTAICLLTYLDKQEIEEVTDFMDRLSDGTKRKFEKGRKQIDSRIKQDLPEHIDD